MKHKIVAIRMNQRRDVVTLTGITESPRGTKTAYGQVKKTLDRFDRPARKEEIAEALTELLDSD